MEVCTPPGVHTPMKTILFDDLAKVIDRLRHLRRNQWNH